MRKARLWVVALAILGLGQVSCTRKMDESSRVGISLKNLKKAGKVGALSFDQISHVVINVSGPGMPGPVVINWDGHRGGTVIAAPDFFEVTVPRGENRLIQILVVAKDSTSGLESFLYGDQLKSISAAEEVADVTVNQIGTGSGTQARVAGRYLTSTGPDAGPTGELELLFQPPVTGRPPMTIMDMPMINGWFQIFYVDGAQFSYRFRHNGQILFGGVDFNNALFAPIDRVLHIVQPSGTGFWGGSEVEARPEERFVVGFFGPAAATGIRAACYNSTVGSVPNLYSDAYPAHTTLMIYDPTSTATNKVRRLGNTGGSASNTTACTSKTAFVNRIDFDGKNVGGGRAKALGFESVFALPGGAYESIATSYSSGNMNISWNYLSSDVIGPNGADGVAVLVSTTGFEGDLGMGSDGANCGALLRDSSATGFYLAGTTTGTSLTVPMSAAEAGDARIAVCPYKDNYLGEARHYFSGGRSSNDSGGGPTGPATQIGFRQGSMVVNEFACTELEVVLLNASNSYSDPSLNTSGVTANLSYSGPTVTFRSGGCSGGTVSSVNIPPSSNSTRVGIQSSTGTGAGTLTATSASPALPAESGGAGFTVAPMSDVTVIQVANASNNYLQAMPINTCTEVHFNYGNNSGAATTYAAMTLNLSGNPGLQFFETNPNCLAGTLAVTSVNVPASTGSTVLYLKSSQSGWNSIMPSVTGYTPTSGPAYNLSGMHGVPVGAAGVPVTLKINLGAPALGMNSCTAVSVQTVDAYMNPANATSLLNPINLSLMGGIAASLWADSGCSASLPGPSVSINSGSSTSQTFYLNPSSPSGSGSISATHNPGGGGQYWYGQLQISYP